MEKGAEIYAKGHAKLEARKDKGKGKGKGAEGKEYVASVTFTVMAAAHSVDDRTEMVDRECVDSPMKKTPGAASV